MRDIMVVAAHPDDEVLGCGGTMARLSSQGDRVYTVILGEGITSRDAKRDRQKRESQIQCLKSQVEDISGMLGSKKSFLFDFPDNRFDSVELLDIVKVIEGVKKAVEPDVVYTHFHGDLNIDHRLTFDAVMTAFRPVSHEKTSQIYSFEVASSTEWSFGRVGGTYTPNTFVDITSHIESKLSAMRAYEGELRGFPHPRSAESIRIQARHWGSVVGLEYAESFELVRSIIR